MDSLRNVSRTDRRFHSYIYLTSSVQRILPIFANSYLVTGICSCTWIFTSFKYREFFSWREIEKLWLNRAFGNYSEHLVIKYQSWLRVTLLGQNKSFARKILFGPAARLEKWVFEPQLHRLNLNWIVPRWIMKLIQTQPPNFLFFQFCLHPSLLVSYTPCFYSFR